MRVGQLITGQALLVANKRQSYDVTICLSIDGTNTTSSNVLDLKNPYFRYTGAPTQPPHGTTTQSPSEAYWSHLDATQMNSGKFVKFRFVPENGLSYSLSVLILSFSACLAGSPYTNGYTMNGIGDVTMDLMAMSNTTCNWSSHGCDGDHNSLQTTKRLQYFYYFFFIFFPTIHHEKQTAAESWCCYCNFHSIYCMF